LISRLSLAHLLEKLVLVAFFLGLIAVPAEFFVSAAAPKKEKQNDSACQQQQGCFTPLQGCFTPLQE
jgi:hypothetical protein